MAPCIVCKQQSEVLFMNFKHFELNKWQTMTGRGVMFQIQVDAHSKTMVRIPLEA